ncbi:MAG: SPOR domain-containing protein [Terriglobales bacterium]
MADEDREITLGTGKLLGFFLGLVVVCAFFFVAGFTLGKNSVPTAPTAEVLPAPAPTSTTAKPSAVPTAAVKPDCSVTPEGCPPAGSNELAFSKETVASAANPVPAALPAATVSTPAPVTTPEASRPVTQPSYTVQVAAVSKQQDAEALASALRKKSYQVNVITPTSDNLFHVQVGPFADIKDAEAMRTRLLSDGYNPIVKR